MNDDNNVFEGDYFWDINAKTKATKSLIKEPRIWALNSNAAVKMKVRCQQTRKGFPKNLIIAFTT